MYVSNQESGCTSNRLLNISICMANRNCKLTHELHWTPGYIFPKYEIFSR